MTQDVEMKELPSNSVTSSSTPSTLQRTVHISPSKLSIPSINLICNFVLLISDLKEIASLIETAAHAREVRRILRAVRLTMALRRKLKAPVLSAFLNLALTPGSEVHTRLVSFLPKVNLVFLPYLGLFLSKFGVGE